jgi:hypothetical protein
MLLLDESRTVSGNSKHNCTVEPFWTEIFALWAAEIFRETCTHVIVHM